MALFGNKSRRRERAQLARLEKWSRNPIDSWPGCPMCGHDFPERVASAAHCLQCNLYFTGWALRPEVSDDDHDFGHLVGTRPQPPLTIERYIRGRARVWVARPRSARGAPLVLPLHSIEEAAYGEPPGMG